MSPKGRYVVAPRLYCDICDCFDAHDTEDCPKQASSDSPPPSQHHGERGSTRPYCDTCEGKVKLIFNICCDVKPVC